MNTTESTQAIVQQFCQALADRNLDKLISLFAEEIDWYIPGNAKVAPWLGKRTHKGEVIQFFRLLWSSTEPINATIDCLLAENNLAVVTGAFSTRMLQTGKVVASLFSIHLTVRDKVIVKYRLLEDSYAVFESLRTD